MKKFKGSWIFLRMSPMLCALFKTWLTDLMLFWAGFIECCQTVSYYTVFVKTLPGWMLNPLPFPSAFSVLEGSIHLTALDLIMGGTKIQLSTKCNISNSYYKLANISNNCCQSFNQSINK